MLALGLSMHTAIALVPALLGGAGPPPLPTGFAFVSLNGGYLLFAGNYLIVETI